MASYPIPQWLQPYGDPGQLYLEAQRQSAQLEMSKEKLEADERMAHMENQARAAVATQRAREAQQRAEIAKARITAEIGLRSQAIDVQRARVNQAAQQAAQRYAAQQMLSQRIGQGETPIQAALRTPGLGLTGAGYANLARAGTPQPTMEPTWTRDPNTGKLIPYNARTGEPRPPAQAHIPEGAMTQQQRAEEQFLKSRLPALDKQINDPLAQRAEKRTDDQISKLPKDEQAAATKARDDARDARKERNAVLKRIQELVRPQQGAGPAAPPKSAEGSTAKQKAARANELQEEHPDWTREQILAQVRKEFK